MELSKTKFGLYSSLANAKMRKRHGLFTVEGRKSVADSMSSFQCEALLVEKGAEPGFDTMNAPVFEVSADQMRRLSNLSTCSPVMGVFRLPDSGETSLELEEGLYLALDGVQDPGNLGTIVRTCHWFGILRIFASRDTVDLFNPKTIQSAMGSIGKVKVVYCDLPELFCANPSMPVCGTLLEGENLFETSLPRYGFIVMGNEGKGLSEEVRKMVSKPLFIPPYCSDHSESLNVSIATAIVVAQFRK